MRSSIASGKTHRKWAVCDRALSLALNRIATGPSTFGGSRRRFDIHPIAVPWAWAAGDQESDYAKFNKKDTRGEVAEPG